MVRTRLIFNQICFLGVLPCCLPARHRGFLSLTHRPHDRSAPPTGGALLAHALAADRSLGLAPVLAQGTRWAGHARSGPLWRGTSACGAHLQRRAPPRTTAGDDLLAVPQARFQRVRRGRGAVLG